MSLKKMGQIVRMLQWNLLNIRNVKITLKSQVARMLQWNLLNIRNVKITLKSNDNKNNNFCGITFGAGV